MAICLALSSAGFDASRDDYANAGDNCGRNYPGDPVCDELSDGADDFVVPTVSACKSMALMNLLSAAGGVCSDYWNRCCCCGMGDHLFSCWLQ